ncbi:tRNA N(3)-methylcytidine methyltransferase METTL6 isoform X2 [Frankliniella occidentalis]|uniref:tRNA N(3)-methylcytidine methyltransferase n=1 Tax=Frankliniella occidentalis TaxID=133901 RepID=A0A6J1TJX4_FRAOC|nr:tRNA N(3)-methylcytidine methyltransferase METTL6 isoform X2 [Frankliniella occidentalis]
MPYVSYNQMLCNLTVRSLEMSHTDDATPTGHAARTLSEEDRQKLKKQDSRLVSSFQALQLEKNAKKHWDLFYKRNETRFFKDRHWTTREFFELVGSADETRTLLEVGCGVGNLIYPLIEEGMNFFVYACDLSPRAVDFVKSNEKYDETKMKAFQCDITSEDIFTVIPDNSVDIVTLIFVLSAIHPDNFVVTLSNIFKILKSGGLLLLRDYGLFDMAQLRFKPGNKISDNFYMRQDGTRSYFFSEECLKDLLVQCGFEVIENSYVQRKTINLKEDIDADRVFIQGKYRKPPVEQA